MPLFHHKKIDCFDTMELFSSEDENDYFPFHFHDFFCVSLITKGTEILKTQQQEFMAPTGTISITQANEIHRNFSFDVDGYSYNTFYVNPEILSYFSEGKKIEALERVIYHQSLFNHFKKLFEAERYDVKRWEEGFKKLAAFAVSPAANNEMDFRFSEIDAIIDGHPNVPIDAAWLARKFFMSKFHFIREFKKMKGVTPQTYIMLYRLGKAKKLLLQNLPVNDVAYHAGFCDASHFINNFKKYFGLTPGVLVDAEK